jgi:hypothetical protein
METGVFPKYMALKGYINIPRDRCALSRDGKKISSRQPARVAMNVRPSSDLRNNYNVVSKQCKES